MKDTVRPFTLPTITHRWLGFFVGEGEGHSLRYAHSVRLSVKDEVVRWNTFFVQVTMMCSSHQEARALFNGLGEKTIKWVCEESAREACDKHNKGSRVCYVRSISMKDVDIAKQLEALAMRGLIACEEDEELVN